MAGARILVVEDEGIVALDIQRRLEGVGYRVCGAVASGEEAVKKASEMHPDLVLMDILLEGTVDGIQAAEQIRNRFDVPVVYLSAYADEGTLARAKLTGPYGYVLKPFKERELRSVIEMALYKHRMERRLTFLFQATGSIFAEPMEYEARLAALARASVPELGDWCLIDLVEPDGSLRRMAVSGPDRAGEEWARGLPSRFSADRLERFGIPRVLRTGGAEILPQVPAGGTPPPDGDLLSRIKVNACMAIPIRVEGKILGVMILASAESGRRYGPEDLVLAEDLVRRAALSVENARLYEETKRAVRAREDLLAIVSHDLRSPIGVIMSTADQMLGTAFAKGPDASEGLRRILRCAERMNQLLGSLLDAARIEAGHLSIEKQLNDAAALVDEAVDLAHTAAQKKNIRIEKLATGKGIRLHCDRIRILQVLSNVLGNAVKFSPAGTTITVQARVRGDELLFSVADMGPGIPEEHRTLVFDRYWQSPGKERMGTGLGLFIAKGIVETHGGKIWIESGSPSGSVFLFTLPLRTP